MSKVAPDAYAINEYFAKIGSVLAAEIKPSDNKNKINRDKETMVTTPTNTQEMAKMLNRIAEQM